MSQSTSGPCLVCGEETTSRCEACRQAGLDLFFCSREHQKLLWPVHKKVCGPGKANPFTWPALSQHEADEAKKRLDTTAWPAKCGVMPGLSLLLVAEGIITPASQASVLDSLVEGSACGLSRTRKQRILLKLRALERERWGPEPFGSLTTVEEVLREASAFVFHHFDEHLPSTADPNHQPSWLARSLHLLLTWIGLTFAFDAHQTVALRQQARLHLSGARQRFMVFLEREVRRTSPQVADSALQALALAQQTTNEHLRNSL